MATLKQLKSSARHSAEWRGHNIGKFITLDPYVSAEAVCRKCGKAVYVNSEPMPNEITISGEAVALGCDD